MLLSAALALGMIWPLRLAKVCAQNPEQEPAQLIPLLNDKEESVRAQTAVRLKKMGAAAVPELIKALKNEDAYIRMKAADILGSIGLAAKDSVPALIEALKDKNIFVRSKASKALKRIQSAAEDFYGRPTIVYRATKDMEEIPLLPERSIPLLIEDLGHGDKLVRRNAAKALALMGPKAEPALSVLTKALEDYEPAVRYHAASALGHIGPAAQDSKYALMQALQDKDHGVRVQAAQALGKIKPKSQDVVLALIRALSDKDILVRASAMRALQVINPNAALDLIPKLKSEFIRNLGHEDEGIRFYATLALKELGLLAPEALNPLLETLKDTQASVRQGAAQALVRMGPEILPALIRAWRENRDREVRKILADRFVEEGTRAVPALQEFLKSAPRLLRLEVLEIFAQMGPSAKAALPRIIQLLKIRKNDLQTEQEQDAQVPLALNAAELELHRDDIRFRAIHALEQMGKEAKESVPTLAELLSDDNKNIRFKAAQALEKIGTPEAVSALTRYQNKIKSD
jgi:HEAT repeat protein